MGDGRCIVLRSEDFSLVHKSYSIKSVPLGEDSKSLTTLDGTLGSRVYGRYLVGTFVRKDSPRQSQVDTTKKIYEGSTWVYGVVES